MVTLGELVQGYSAPSARAVSLPGPLASRCQLLAIAFQEAMKETGGSSSKGASPQCGIKEGARKFLKMDAITIRVRVLGG